MGRKKLRTANNEDDERNAEKVLNDICAASTVGAHTPSSALCSRNEEETFSNENVQEEEPSINNNLVAHLPTHNPKTTEKKKEAEKEKERITETEAIEGRKEKDKNVAEKAEKDKQTESQEIKKEEEKKKLKINNSNNNSITTSSPKKEKEEVERENVEKVEEVEEIIAGEVVACHLRGYPWWPAIVLKKLPKQKFCVLWLLSNTERPYTTETSLLSHSQILCWMEGKTKVKSSLEAIKKDNKKRSDLEVCFLIASDIYEGNIEPPEYVLDEFERDGMSYKTIAEEVKKKRRERELRVKREMIIKNACDQTKEEKKEKINYVKSNRDSEEEKMTNKNVGECRIYNKRGRSIMKEETSADLNNNNNNNSSGSIDEMKRNAEVKEKKNEQEKEEEKKRKAKRIKIDGRRNNYSDDDSSLLCKEENESDEMLDRDTHIQEKINKDEKKKLLTRSKSKNTKTVECISIQKKEENKNNGKNLQEKKKTEGRKKNEEEGDEEKEKEEEEEKQQKEKEKKKKKQENEKEEKENKINETDRSNQNVIVVLPYTLQRRLFDDKMKIRDEKKLNRLPSDPSVKKIIQFYFQKKTKNEKNICKHDVDFLMVFTEGVEEFFNEACGAMLLYSEERKQYEEECVGRKAPPSEVYGVNHLIRLFVKLSSFISAEHKILEKKKQAERPGACSTNEDVCHHKFDKENNNNSFNNYTNSSCVSNSQTNTHTPLHTREIYNNNNYNNYSKTNNRANYCSNTFSSEEKNSLLSANDAFDDAVSYDAYDGACRHNLNKSNVNNNNDKYNNNNNITDSNNVSNNNNDKDEQSETRSLFSFMSNNLDNVEPPFTHHEMFEVLDEVKKQSEELLEFVAQMLDEWTAATSYCEPSD